MSPRSACIQFVAVFTFVLVAATFSAKAEPYRFPSPTGHFEGVPAFSPDGKMIAAFVRGSTAPGDNGLTLINTALWKKMPIGDAPLQLSWRSTMAFSPDGRQLLVDAAAGSDFADLWVMEVETRKWARVTGSNRSPGRWGLGKWSSDGTRMLAGGGGNPWTIWSDAGGVTPVLFADWPSSAIADVAWASDGKSLWVGVNTEAAPQTNTAVSVTTVASQPVAGLYRMALANHTSKLVVQIDSIRSVDPSPLAGVVACVTRGSRLVIVDSAEQTAQTIGRASGELTWSPDGKLLAVRTPRGPALYDVAARRRQPLPAGADAIFFSPGSQVWASSGNRLVSLFDIIWQMRFQLGAERETALAVRDLNDDGAVDGTDILIFVQCAAGPNLPPSPKCPPGVDVDYNQDGHVDLADYVIFKSNVHPKDFHLKPGVIVVK